MLARGRDFDSVTPCYCYILECADGTFYTGWTTDPQKRLARHNQGGGAKYTRARRPVRLIYVEEQPDRRAALRREIQIKKMSRAEKWKLARDWLTTFSKSGFGL